MVVGAIIHVDLETRAQLALVFLESGFEPAGPQAAAIQPGGHDAVEHGQQRTWVKARCA
jgi:hypothetical protein